MRRRSFLGRIAVGAVTTCATPVTFAARPRSEYARRMAQFDRAHSGDFWLGPERGGLLEGVVARLGRVQSTVGHGNFYTLGFDQMVRIARRYSGVGTFSRRELEFLDELFHADAAAYGFLGEKVSEGLTEQVPGREVVRVPRTGQRILRGPALEQFERMRRAVGEDLVLTSGIRGIVKQTHLFVRKTLRCDGNLSRASRSLAPPGYSYHAVGDFDVGQRGLGAANFTERFARTPVYRRLVALGYLVERYPVGNQLGVRYEPWHVKVV